MSMEKKLKTFSFKQIATLLIREADIREGYWGIYARFGLSATNLRLPGDQTIPAAIIPLLEVGLQEFDNLTSLTVDAKEAWKSSRKKQPKEPKSKAKKSPKSRSTA